MTKGFLAVHIHVDFSQSDLYILYLGWKTSCFN